MEASATGSGPAVIYRPAPRESGMTLIEMLVVLAIIAVIASVSALAIGGPRRLDGRVEARRLEATLQLAADRTMIGDVPQAIAVAPDSYGVMTWNEATGAWQPASGSDQQHALPHGLTLTASDDRRLFPLGADAGGEAFALSLAEQGQTWTVDFDGITARIVGEASGTPQSGATG
ncbi:MAG: prepilin-type N-terminal cleavage/methylation domain-containing protein [Croceibacterium sp.]